MMLTIGCLAVAGFACANFGRLFWNLSCAADYEEPRVPLDARVRSRWLKLLSFITEIASGVSLGAAGALFVVAGKMIWEMLK